MCSNYEIPTREALSFLDVEVDQLDLELKPHVYPGYHAPIIMKGFDLDFGKFGLLPKWAKDFKFSSYTYNARTETVAEKPSFRHAWKYSKFCLVPVQEFYEPKYIDGKSHWYTIKREDDQPKPKQQIVASRSFGVKITELQDLKEAMSKYVQDAVGRLRKEKLLCGVITAFVQSSPFDASVPYYSKAQTYKFAEPTDCVLDLVEVACLLLEKIYKSGINYKKCGVFYSELIEKSNHIPDLLSDHETRIQN